MQEEEEKAQANIAPEKFEIHASVVFQLGESLITDSVQALVELVKNSYDADASFCKVTISTENVNETSSRFNGQTGSIVIEDDGSGMTLDDIRRGWLTISNSSKRDFKKGEFRTKKSRTPLGDKGLGRLGTQRLGYNLEMFTRAEGSAVEQHVWFSWKEFIGQTRLSDVDIRREEIVPTRAHGTRLIISELRELALWRGEAAVKELQTRLSELISPYKAVRDFVVYPLFVAEGSSREKKEKILHSMYLSRSYRSLLNIGGALFVYGVSFAENDEHLCHAIERSKVRYLRVGLYGAPNSLANQAIVTRVMRIAESRPPSKAINVQFFDAVSARVWG